MYAYTWIWYKETYISFCPPIIDRSICVCAHMLAQGKRNTRGVCNICPHRSMNERSFWRFLKPHWFQFQNRERSWTLQSQAVEGHESLGKSLLLTTSTYEHHSKDHLLKANHGKHLHSVKGLINAIDAHDWVALAISLTWSRSWPSNLRSAISEMGSLDSTITIHS